MDEGAVKRRLKTAKMERLARSTDMRREESRGKGRPKMTCCLGIVEVREFGDGTAWSKMRRTERS
jgi:hypothetical protein